MKLSIILNISNRANLFRYTANSIVHYCDPARLSETELLVVDENSQDGLGSILENLKDVFGQIKIIRIDQKLSGLNIQCYNPVLGLNIGALKAASNNLLFIQPETFFLKDNVSWAFDNCEDGKVWLAETYSGSRNFRTNIDQYMFFDGNNFIFHEPHKADKETFVQNYVGKADQNYPYVVATTKHNMMDIGLLDVRYAEGWAGDDDDWLLRHRVVGHYIGVVDWMSCYHINHNKHDENGIPINLDGSPLHLHNVALWKNAMENLTRENVTDRFDYNTDVSSRCILSEEIIYGS